jgi:hypothetical protein
MIMVCIALGLVLPLMLLINLIYLIIGVELLEKFTRKGVNYAWFLEGGVILRLFYVPGKSG